MVVAGVCVESDVPLRQLNVRDSKKLSAERREIRAPEMRKIEDELGAKIGSGYSHDQETIAFLTKWLGEKGTLPPHTRTSWDTSKRLLSANATRKLDEFAGEK